MAFRWGLLIPGLILGCFLSSFPSLSWRDMNTVFAVGREHTVKSVVLAGRLLGNWGAAEEPEVRRWTVAVVGLISGGMAGRKAVKR